MVLAEAALPLVPSVTHPALILQALREALVILETATVQAMAILEVEVILETATVQAMAILEVEVILETAVQAMAILEVEPEMMVTMVMGMMRGTPIPATLEKEGDTTGLATQATVTVVCVNRGGIGPPHQGKVSRG
ncbi:MAG: hypothetical protein GTO12_20150 [Proteobacteria bacterium]|nr:hypothetical protein [Pseudomonadota bacterium]